MTTRASEYEIKKAASRPGIDNNNKFFLEECDRTRTAKLNEQRHLRERLQLQIREHEQERQQNAERQRNTLIQAKADHDAYRRDQANKEAAHRNSQRELLRAQETYARLHDSRVNRDLERDHEIEQKVLDSYQASQSIASDKVKADHDRALRYQEELISATRVMLQHKEAVKEAERRRMANEVDHPVVTHHSVDRSKFLSFIEKHGELSAEPNTVPQMSLPKELRCPELYHLPSHAVDAKWRAQYLKEQQDERRQQKRNNNAVWTADMVAASQARQRSEQCKRQDRREIDETTQRMKEQSERVKQESLRLQQMYSQQLDAQLREKLKTEHEMIFAQNSLSRSAPRTEYSSCS
jgi:hypothetical protein